MQLLVKKSKPKVYESQLINITVIMQQLKVILKNQVILVKL